MTTKVKFSILGAGPSGLSLAARLLQLGEKSFLVLEGQEEAGGLCRSKVVDGSPIDIGGGHFLDVRRKKVLDFVFQFMPEDEWELFNRISKIRTDRFEIDYPYEANIWQLPIDDQVEHLISIMNAGSNQGKPMPSKFQNWITWKLGDVIAQNYMLPYNAKVFAPYSEDLGTYWLYKLPNVSLEETLLSCLQHQPFGNLPAHGQFFYPKQHGYGELFLRMAAMVGNHLILNQPVKSIDVETLTVNENIQADCVVNTIPWPEFGNNCSIPAKVREYIRNLKYSSIDIVYRNETENTDAHWIYFPDKSLTFHRILYRYNFLRGSRGYWQEVNSVFTKNDSNILHHNQYAYPLNTRKKPIEIKRILDWALTRSIIGLGRWGEWEHMNSDIAMEKGLLLAEQLVNQ